MPTGSSPALHPRRVSLFPLYFSFEHGHAHLRPLILTAQNNDNNGELQGSGEVFSSAVTSSLSPCRSRDRCMHHSVAAEIDNAEKMRRRFLRFTYKVSSRLRSAEERNLRCVYIVAKAGTVKAFASEKAFCSFENTVTSTFYKLDNGFVTSKAREFPCRSLNSIDIEHLPEHWWMTIITKYTVVYCCRRFKSHFKSHTHTHTYAFRFNQTYTYHKEKFAI